MNTIGKTLAALTLTTLAFPAFADTAPEHERDAEVGDWRL